MADLSNLSSVLWKFINDLYDSTKDRIEGVKVNKEIALDNGEVKSVEELFREKFDMFYNKLEEKYVAHLKHENRYENCSGMDRHKISAILICSIIDSKIFEAEEEREGYFFIGLEKIAVLIGLEYMLYEFNKKLAESGHSEIEDYVLPCALACPTPYLDIFARSLYYNTIHYAGPPKKERRVLDVMDLAERLFLLEYITIERHNIPIIDLIEYDIDDTNA